MGCSEQSQERQSPHLTSRQFKPYIDGNLQLQIGQSSKSSGEELRPHSPIYSHYIGNSPLVPSYLTSEINEYELYHTMQEAQQGYEAWIKMKEKIQENITRCSNNPSN